MPAPEHTFTGLRLARVEQLCRNPVYSDAVDDAVLTIAAHLEREKHVIASSSFQTHSIPMLAIVAAAGSVPVYFLDTGFHFPETLTYRDQISAMFDLRVVSLRSTVSKLAQTTASGSLLFAEDPDYCCYLNKTAPMEPVAAGCDVWISGVRREQNENRSTFDRIMAGPNGSVRYHPMLDWTDAMIREFIDDHGIPGHPLDGRGYASIGCAPCTHRVSSQDDERDARWSGLAKTECGLHIDLVGR